MAADAPRIRPFAAGDEEGFLRAKCAIFDGLVLENERRRWRVEFDGNPAAPAPFPRGFVVEEGSAIRGGIAFLPCRVQIGAEVAVGACGIDLCVDPRLRGRGLGRELLRRWLDPSLSRFAFTIAMRGPAIDLLRSLGAGVGDGDGERGPFVWVRYADAAHEEPPQRELLEIETPAELPPDTDELEARSRRGMRLVLVRDAVYLRWRWREVPFGGVTMIRALARGNRADSGGATRGLAFVQDDARRNFCHVADLICVRDDAAAQRSLLRRSIAVANALGRKVLWYLTSDREAAALLREEGFELFNGARPSFVTKLNAPPRSDVSETVRGEEWSPSLGDCDMLFDCNEPRPAAAERPREGAPSDGR